MDGRQCADELAAPHKTVFLAASGGRLSGSEINKVDN
jgi:hypothetical protein